MSLLLAAQPTTVKAATPAEVGPCVAGWQEMPIPDGALGSTPWQVVTRGGRATWVVGGSSEGLAALRWRDGAWVEVRTGTSGHLGISSAVADRRASLLGVGYARPLPRTMRPLSGRMGSAGWSGRGAPHVAGTHAALGSLAVLPSGRAWAVGTRLAAGRGRPIALRWDGRDWDEAAPTASARDAGLLGVARGTQGPVWAVGWKGAGKGRLRPFIVRRERSGWVPIPSAPLAAGSAVLTAVAFKDANEGWATGFLVKAGTSTYRPILQRWDGRAWRSVGMSWAAGTSAVPRSLSLSEDGEPWIAGTQLATSSREARGFVAWRQGGAWSVSVLGVPASLRSELFSVAATASGAVASGRVGASALVLRSCEGTVAAEARRRISVGDIRKRRRVSERHAPEGQVQDASAAGTGRAQPLARPVAPSGFELRDVTRAVGLDETGPTWSGLTADLDEDGWTDVFYSRHGRLPRLALGGRDGFVEAPGDAFSVIDRHGCDAADVDGDGAPDILCAVGRAQGKAIGRHELSMRPAYPDGSVALDTAGLADPFGRGRLVAFLRLDGDPWPEAFIVSAAERPDLLPGGNRFFRHAPGGYVAAPEVGLDRPVGGACLLAVDVDHDGDEDLLHCQTHPDDGRRPGLRVHRNEGGRLRERSRALGLEPMGDVDALLVDVTGDGRRDLIQLSARRLRVSRGRRSGFALIYQARSRQGAALAAGDASGDGQPDIYVLRGGRTGNRADLLLVNDGTGRAFTSVRIPQTTAGKADDVMALDHDHNGLTDFLVLNGRDRPGPVQLLASYPDD